jgi:hypothetical protein
LPPYVYQKTGAYLFLPASVLEHAVLFGDFPETPLGPFSEIWLSIGPAHRSFRPDAIFVNNAARLEAGRNFWKMPKILAAVNIDVSNCGARVEAQAGISRWNACFSWKHPLVSKRVISNFNLPLQLPYGSSASLVFQFASEPVNATYSGSNAEKTTGTIMLLSGRAVLSAPTTI